MLVEALVAGVTTLNAVDRPFRDADLAVTPRKHLFNVLDLLLGPSQRREELLNVEEFRSELQSVIAAALELFAELLEKGAFSSVETFDEERPERLQVLQRPDATSIAIEETV